MSLLIWVLCRFLSLPFRVIRMEDCVWWLALSPCFWRRASASLSFRVCSSCLQPLLVFKSVEFLGLCHWPGIFTGAVLFWTGEEIPGPRLLLAGSHGRNSWGQMLFSPAQQPRGWDSLACWLWWPVVAPCQPTVVFKSWFNGLSF